MKKTIIDFKLLGGLVIAYLLIFISFDNKQVFWYIYTATMLFLISYSIIYEKADDELPTNKYVIYGILSGIGLFSIFWAGNWIFSIITTSFPKKVDKLYSIFALTDIWQYLVLFLIIVPGEEFFWRGFVQKRLMHSMNTWLAVFCVCYFECYSISFYRLPYSAFSSFY